MFAVITNPKGVTGGPQLCCGKAGLLSFFRFLCVLLFCQVLPIGYDLTDLLVKKPSGFNLGGLFPLKIKKQLSELYQQIGGGPSLNR